MGIFIGENQDPWSSMLCWTEGKHVKFCLLFNGLYSQLHIDLVWSYWAHVTDIKKCYLLWYGKKCYFRMVLYPGEWKIIKLLLRSLFFHCTSENSESQLVIKHSFYSYASSHLNRGSFRKLTFIFCRSLYYP